MFIAGNTKTEQEFNSEQNAIIMSIGHVNAICIYYMSIFAYVKMILLLHLVQNKCKSFFAYTKLAWM